MLPHYVVVNGIEVISTGRAAAYGAQTDSCGVPVAACWDCPPESAEWLNLNEPYEGVVADPAPWYDSAVPESASVVGIAGIELEDMAVRVAAGTGSNPTRRTFTLRFVVFLSDECARDYIHGWLSNVFGPSPCATSCVGNEVCMLACCPVVDDDGELIGPDPLRYVTGVEVVSGPTLVGEAYNPGDNWLEYEVTLATANVYVYRPPPPERKFTIRPSDGPQVVIDLPEAYAACPDEDECIDALLCGQQEFAPLPAEPLPACYPADPFPAHRTLISVPSGVMPSGIDVIPVIRVAAGNTRLQNLTVRFYANPLDIGCDRLPSLNPCRACMDLTVAEIPANSTLVMSGISGLNTISCPSARGTLVDVPAQVYGPPVDGAGAGYVDAVECGPGLCIEVYTAVGVAINAEIMLEFWTRTNGA